MRRAMARRCPSSWPLSPAQVSAVPSIIGRGGFWGFAATSRVPLLDKAVPASYNSLRP